MAQALRTALYAQGFNIGMNNFEAAGQVVFHAHIHVIPRYFSDGSLKLFPQESYKPGDLEKSPFIKGGFRGILIFTASVAAGAILPVLPRSRGFLLQEPRFFRDGHGLAIDGGHRHQTHQRIGQPDAIGLKQLRAGGGNLG